ncbi:MAG: hypothetical protein KZQ95_11605 [Candidatus Thiodiazotropha sp. (ex Epidulcina cf. delphinae)]|nr:hypothetical protein [Candidatus Thiodiazotropha sp. (ex Epidulcina cf. delphinae)]
MLHDAEQGVGVALAVGFAGQVQAPDPLQGNRAGRPLIGLDSGEYFFLTTKLDRHTIGHSVDIHFYLSGRVSG